ncbi:proton channel OTOP2 [Dasypus novemcinctus]|uniref:proton channel OTOP2 n=1 Tax=Dasypus novemcinctus TaxID=9361 RepID=UPI000328B377|nr:proton channel OTOP2 [Dasypus novemcinctus]XP_058140674.1 proton channel OTOP2 [Dasypus novemcinctus]XP_058140675.1 proton channel OTOP2 [Dasypus novemcinctus]
MSEERAPGPKESPPAPRPGPREVWKKGGRLLSVLLAVNVLLLACTLISGGAFNKVAVCDTDVFALLSTMMLLAVVWTLFYLLRTARCPDAVPYRDSHAGPIWLRGGLVLFGVCTLVMDVFKTGYYSSFFECQSAIKILYPLIQAVFVIVQTYFLWVSSKDCIHIHLDLTRCGLMFTLATNLAIWMAAVVDESVHQAHVYSSAHSNASHARLAPDLERAGSQPGGDPCSCNTVICQIFQQGYFYLYPFNIEYSLFASTMLYVMWKNVGRLLPSTPGHGHAPSRVSLFRETFLAGPVLGLLLFVVGLAVFVIYEVQVSGDGGRTKQALVIYYSFNIVCLGLMTLVSLSGSVIYRFDRRAMDHHKNPTRTLDVALLMGAALGQYAISYYSIVAMVVGLPRDLLGGLNLAYALLMIAQHTFQNVFIIESLHRGPPGAEPQDTPPKEPCHGLTFANLDALHTLPSGPPTPRLVDPSPAGPQEAVAVILAPRGHWRRRCLKDISLFLLLCNVILWIMPAFGARPHFRNTVEVDFYGYSLWAAIVNICLPFGIFYRMHAVSSLLEVYVLS